MISRNLVVGVDPGLNGGISWIDRESRELETVVDIPTVLLPNKKRQIDAAHLSLLIDCCSKRTAFAVIEQVGVMTGMEGRVSMFNFGFGAGMITGILAAYMIPVFYVTPSVWKGSLGLSRDKNESRKKASGLFPSFGGYFLRKKDDGRAESALLAYFGALKIVW